MRTGFRGRGRPARRGFILVTVLLVSTMLLSCAMGYAWYARGQIRRVMKERSVLQARSIAYVLAGEVARGLVMDKSAYDSKKEPWFKPMIFPIPEIGILTVEVTPLNDRIPIASLFLPDGETLRLEMKSVWENLWSLLKADDVGNIVLDFLDANKMPRLGGREDKKWLNRPVVSLSELLAIPEVTREILSGTFDRAGLEAYCTVWSDGKININMAPAHVLELFDDIDRNVAEDIIEARADKPFENIGDVAAVGSFPQQSLPKLMNLISFTSTFFRVTIDAATMEGDLLKRFAFIIKKGTGSCSLVSWEEY